MSSHVPSRSTWLAAGLVVLASLLLVRAIASVVVGISGLVRWE